MLAFLASERVRGFSDSSAGLREGGREGGRKEGREEEREEERDGGSPARL